MIVGCAVRTPTNVKLRWSVELAWMAIEIVKVFVFSINLRNNHEEHEAFNLLN